MCPSNIFATWRNIHKMCGAVLLRAVWTDSLLKLFGSSERMRAKTQGEGEWDLPSDDIFNYVLITLFGKYSFLLKMLQITWTKRGVHPNRNCCKRLLSVYSHTCSAIYIDMKFSVQNLKKKLFTRTDSMFCLSLEKWELLHPLRLACLTPWASSESGEDWVAVH